MYKTRFKAWGLDKNNKNFEVRKILRLRAMRASLGKKSEFLLRGRAVEMADIERYAKRKGLLIASKHPRLPEDDTVQNLICITPPSMPPPIDAPTSSRNVEGFLVCLQAFLEDSLQSGYWTLDKDIMGFSNVHSPEYPHSARNEFFLSVERGIHRHRWDDFTQACRQWQHAFSQLQFFVSSRTPAQLIGLVELVASLAEYNLEIAALLLRYLGNLSTREPTHSDTGFRMLQRLSQIEAEDLKEIVRMSQDCSWKTFRNHFSVQAFFLPESATVLADSSVKLGEDVDSTNLRLQSLMSTSGPYNHQGLRDSRNTIELLMVSERYDQTEYFALTQISRMERMQYDGVVGSALHHAYGNLLHLYMSKGDYEKAYSVMVKMVDNYFEMLIYRTDFPDDFILSTYSQLASLASRLGMQEDARKWNVEYTVLKARTDALGEMELSKLRMTTVRELARSNDNFSLAEFESSLSPAPLPAIVIEGNIGAGPRLCIGHAFDDEIAGGIARSSEIAFHFAFSAFSALGKGVNRPCNGTHSDEWQRSEESRPTTPTLCQHRRRQRVASRLESAWRSLVGWSNVLPRAALQVSVRLERLSKADTRR